MVSAWCRRNPRQRDRPAQLILHGLDQWAHGKPPTVAAAAVVGVVTFACGWLAPDEKHTST
jgi:hypothetical protein